MARRGGRAEDQKRSRTGYKMPTADFSLLKQNVQPPGSPETAVTKRGFKSKGNHAAVQFGDFFRHRILIKFGQKINEYVLAKFERQKRTQDQFRKSKQPKRMQEIQRKPKET